MYLILLAVLLVPQLAGSPATEITWQQFEKDILSRKAVARLEVVNGETVEVYLKPAFAKDKQFRDSFKSTWGTN